MNTFIEKLRDVYRWFWRWKFVILTHRDYAARLNRSMEVEQVLLKCATQQRGPLTPAECRELAIKLGIPVEFRSANELLGTG